MSYDKKIDPMPLVRGRQVGYNSAEQEVSVEMFYIVYIYHATRNNIVNVKVFILSIELIVLLDRSFLFPFILLIKQAVSPNGQNKDVFSLLARGMFLACS